ncbi:MAG: hypothetical protein ACXVRV_09555, partial [Gaiellaceae bacterium]
HRRLEHRQERAATRGSVDTAADQGLRKDKLARASVENRGRAALHPVRGLVASAAVATADDLLHLVDHTDEQPEGYGGRDA